MLAEVSLAAAGTINEWRTRKSVCETSENIFVMLFKFANVEHFLIESSEISFVWI